jgi:hypothetical protein
VTEATVEARCADERLHDALPAFCFHELSAEDRQAVALHAVACEVCWAELQHLEAAVRTLRTDARLPPVPLTAEVIAAAKLSGGQAWSFGGHMAFVLLSATLHALLYAASLWTELGYSFDQYSRLLFSLTPVVFGWVSAATLVSLWVSSRVTRAGGRRALAWSVLILLSAISVLLGGLYFMLPHSPTVHAAFATRSAFDGYLKNVFMYFVPLALAFVLVPFQVIVALTRELEQGRAGNTAALLARDRQAFQPQGVWFIQPAVLGALLVVGGLVGYAGTSHVLDALEPGAYANLFTRALYIRVGLWFVAAGTGLAWYWRRLQDLKQVALLMKRLDVPSDS